MIRELKEATKGNDPPKALRRFPDWDEARQMIDGGMAIGSHTLSHTVLNQLELKQQRDELTQSRALLVQELGIRADSLAYPVGGTTSFSEQTMRLAREAGCRAAFSYCAGTNLPGATSPYDMRRIGVDQQSRPRFRAQSTICGITGSYWP